MANLTNYRILLSRPGGAAFQSGEIVRGIVVFDIQDGPALQNIPLLRLIVRGTSCINLGGDSGKKTRITCISTVLATVESKRQPQIW